MMFFFSILYGWEERSPDSGDIGIDQEGILQPEGKSERCGGDPIVDVIENIQYIISWKM